MSNAFDTSGPSLLASTKEGRRMFKPKQQKFSKNMPPISLPNSSVYGPPQMMKRKKDGGK